MPKFYRNKNTNVKMSVMKSMDHAEVVRASDFKSLKKLTEVYREKPEYYCNVHDLKEIFTHLPEEMVETISCYIQPPCIEQLLRTPWVSYCWYVNIDYPWRSHFGVRPTITLLKSKRRYDCDFEEYDGGIDISYLFKTNNIEHENKFTYKKINEHSISELKALCKMNGIKGYSRLKRNELINLYLKA